MLMMIVSLGPILAPTVGGWFITHLGWRSVFVFQCVFGLGLLAAMHAVLAESRDAQYIVPISIGRVVSSYRRLLFDRQFVGYSLIAGFGMGALFCFVAGSPIVLTRMYDLSPQAFGWLLGLNGLAFMSASRVNMVALRKQTPAQLLARAVWIPAVVGVILIALALVMRPPLWSVLILQFLFFLGYASVSPNVSALALAPHAREAGSASALMGSMQSAVSMLAAAAVATFTDGTLRTLAIIMTVGATCAGLSYLWTRKVAT
jgi:DHA1 family bicyclomycin/chloramphenicol resistance-like MFS transporter